jgi:hypothetical protein
MKKCLYFSQGNLTMRAADGGESARFTGIVPASSFFCSQTFAYARPLSAANANRWALEENTTFITESSQE